MTSLEAALSYARRGWLVLPVRHGRKTPATRHGLLDATADAGCITAYWRRRPRDGVAIRTGRESGLVVLDVDVDRGGDDALHDLERSYEPLRTVESITGSGGRHLLFRHPGGTVVNHVGKRGLDVRGDGGYIVAPPSWHPSGRRYEWSVDGHPDEHEPAPLPPWLLRTLAPPRGESPRTPAEAWVRLLEAGLAQGERNAGLTRLVGHLLRHGVDPHVVRQLAHAVNQTRCRPPLPALEVDRITTSITTRERARRRGHRRQP